MYRESEKPKRMASTKSQPSLGKFVKRKASKEEQRVSPLDLNLDVEFSATKVRARPVTGARSRSLNRAQTQAAAPMDLIQLKDLNTTSFIPLAEQRQMVDTINH